MIKVERPPKHDDYLDAIPKELREGPFELGIYSSKRLVITQWAEATGVLFCVIGYRSITQYEASGIIPKGLVDKVIEKNLQVIEVGAGLAELVPAIALRAKKPPIVVDPLDYDRIGFLLKRALQCVELEKENRSLIYELQRRIAIYKDPDLVTLYNMTLKEACQRYPKLRGAADFVVDVSGALLYSDNPEESFQLESSLLPQGNSFGKYFYATMQGVKFS